MDDSKPTRRRVLAGLAGSAVAICCADHALARSDVRTPVATERSSDTGSDTSLGVARLEALEVADGLRIHPRHTWGADLAPRGPMAAEDVRFLLVHHTASSNTVPDPRAVIRGVHAFHTGPQKRWPDVAYNFFVAPDGSVWEGRAGSLAGPVEASASGGNQGYSQLVCLLGNHVAVAPTPAAQDSLVRTLAWLAGRYDLNLWADATTTFVSRGSDKFPAGSVITTPTISPHRSVTYTACPGDAAVALLPTWRRRAFEVLSATWTTDGLQRARRTSLTPP